MSKGLKWTIGILVVLVIALVAMSKAGVFGKDEGTKVVAEDVQKRTIIETVTASGKVFPEVEVKISPDVSGEIVELNVAEGDTVRKGQVLARIYADIYASQRDQAAAVVRQQEAQVSNSQAQIAGLKAVVNQTYAAYKRQKQLFDEKVISRQEFEQAEQAYLSAKANLDAADENVKATKAAVSSAQSSLQRAAKDLGRTTLTAPMDGVVSLLAIKKGERVAGNSFNVGTEMMRIADLSSIEAQVDVGENDIPKVSVGDTALVEVDAYNNRKFKGVVYKIANPTTSLVSTSTTVTNYKVHIRLLPSSYADLIGNGKPFPFRPNMTASADIQTRTEKDVVTVPLNAVTTRDKKDEAKDKSKVKADEKKDENTPTSSDDDIQEVVFAVQANGTVKKIVVKTGIQDINYIQILSGLATGTKVVVGPYDVVSKTLKDGSKIKVVTKDELVTGSKK
jgi:HlyD family secretion protein